jgi:hypothetical protein
MADPIKWRSKIILCKPEPLNAYGVDPTPTGAANALLLTDVTLQPMEGQEVSRNLERPYLGSQEQLPVGLYSVFSGSFELVGSGTLGVAPAWGPLLRACAAAQVITPDTEPGEGKVEYTPISDDHESVAIHFWIGPNRYVILGGRATAEFSLSALGIPMCRVTVTGMFTVPAEAARPTVDLSHFQVPQVASKTATPVFTIDSIPFVLRDFRLTLGNDIQQRILIPTERIIIVDKDEQISATVEAVPMSLYNPVLRATAPAPRQNITLQHGSIAGRIVTIEADQAVQKRFAGSQENQRIEEWPLTFATLPTAGDDQWKITLT